MEEEGYLVFSPDGDTEALDCNGGIEEHRSARECQLRHSKE